MINIIQKGTASTVRAAVDKLQYSGSFMEIPQLTVSVKSPTAITFEIGDFITWGYDGLTYTLKELPQVHKQATSGSYGEAFVYDNMIFKSALGDVKYIDFLDVVPSSSTSHFSSLPTFSFYGNVFALIDRLNANLGRLYANWVVQAADVESGDIYDALYTERQVDISSPVKVWDALSLVYSMWGLGFVYYYDTGTSKHTIVIGATGGATGNFSYGQGNGLYMVGKAINKEDAIVTRLRAYGSTRNMPARYYNNKTILIDRLLIDDPLLYLPNLMIPYTKWQYTGGYPDPELAYINSNSADVDAADTSYAKYGIREKSIFFDGTNNLKEIYPTIEQITAGEMRAAIAGYSGSQYGLYYSPSVTEYPDATRLDKIKTGDTLTDDGVIKSDTIYTETATYTTQSANEVMTTEVITKRFDPIYYATLDNNGEYKITFTDQQLTVTGINTDITDGTLRVWVQRNGSRVSLSKTIAATLITGGVEFTMPEIEISVPEGGDIYSIELDMDITIPTLGEGELATIHWVLDSGTATYTLTKVIPNTDFSISLKQIGFDIFRFLSNSGQNPVISMTSGACAGREFQIRRADYISATDSWNLTCVRQCDTSLSNQWFPNKNFHIAADDTFVLLNINMPDILIDIAELRLYDEACKWLRKNKEQQYIYEPKVDEVYMAINPQVIKEGMMMPITDTDLGLSGSKLINTVTITENEGAVRTFEVVLRDDADQDLIKYLNSQAKQISSAAVGTITNATTSTTQSVDTLPVTQPAQQTELGYTPENVANKTGVLSENSTAAQYPNAKTVYDFVQLAGDSYIPKTQNTLLKEPTGFKSPESVIVTYSVANRTITLTGTTECYSNGVLISELVSGWVSSPHPATLDSIYYLYYNGSSIVWSDSFPGFQSLFIAVVHYRTNNPFAQRECHGFMQWPSHQLAHFNIGTYRTSGGDISNLVLSSTIADNRRPIISECVIVDEDLPTINSALTSKKYSQRYLNGAGAISYTFQADDIVPLSGSHPYYNSFTTPNYGQTLMPDNSAMTIWLFEVPTTADSASQEIRHAFVQGQSVTLAANASPTALATAVSTESLKSPIDLYLGENSVISSEYVCIHKFVITYSGGNWVIASSIKVTGSRQSQVGSPSGSYLTAVSTDDTIDGNGSPAFPLSVSAYAAKKAGDILQDFSAKKLTTATLLLPQTAPTLASGEAAIYSLDSGFSGETPSGAGSVTSIALTMPTGFSVSGSPITESGTFGVTFASGYFLPTTTQFATKADVSLIGAANGIAPLDSGGKVALQYLPSTLLKYMGVWDASTNTPTLLATDTNRKGQVWNVSVAGTQFGIAFKLGDWLIYNDSGVAEKSDNSDDVVSVNGYTGAVTLKTSDIAEQTNLYYTDARVKAYSDLNYLGISAKAADSDKLDGQDSTYFATATSLSNYLPLSGGIMANTNLVTNLNADLLDGQHSTYFKNVWISVITIGSWSRLCQATNILLGGSFYLTIQYTRNSVVVNNTFLIDFGHNYSGHIITLGTHSYTQIKLRLSSINDADVYVEILDNASGSGTQDVRCSATKIDCTLTPILAYTEGIGTTLVETTTENGNLKINDNLIYHSANSNSTSFAWSASKLTSTTLILPQSAPSLSSGEMAIYGLESGFSGELPSGAGSVTSISMVVPTGLSVSPETITESGTFTISYASGYQMMTATESSKLAGIEANANNYSLPTATGSVLGGVKIGTNVTITDGVISVHNPVTLGTANGLSLSTQELSLGLASASANGALSSTDWSTFNNKAAGDHNHNGTYALISGATTQDFQVKALTMNGALSGATTITASSTIQATTAKLTNLTDDYIPYHISDASGLGDSPMYITNVGGYLSGVFKVGTTNGMASYKAQNSVGSHAILVQYASLEGSSLFGVERANAAALLGIRGDTTPTPMFIGTTSADNVYFGTNGTLAVTINSSQKVGIGYTDRNEKLAVSGSGYFNTTLEVAGVTSLTNTTQSTAYTNGGLVLSGGLGIAKDLYSNGKAVFASSVQMLENINTNLRIPKVAPTSPTSGEYYFYIVE